MSRLRRSNHVFRGQHGPGFFDRAQRRTPWPETRSPIKLSHG